MIDPTAYHAALNATAFSDLSDHGWLRLSGRDRLDLLHRLSTNHVKALSAGSGAPTVLTNASARIIAFLTVYAGADAAFLRTMPEQATTVLRYLQGLIFWQDDVQPADLSGATVQFALYGPGSTAALARLAGRDLSTLADYEWQAAELDGEAVAVHRGGPLEPWAWTLTAPASARASVFDAVARLGPRLDRDTAELLRIEAGLPRWGAELSDQVTPLEAGLLPAVHFNKGCYTGQEVIARQTNYDKVTRNLAGIVFEAGVDLPSLETGPQAEVRGPGRGGFVGSLAYSPSLGRTIGLAVVPRDLAQPGAVLTVVRGDDAYPATVHPLPFARGRSVP